MCSLGACAQWNAIQIQSKRGKTETFLYAIPFYRHLILVQSASGSNPAGVFAHIGIVVANRRVRPKFERFQCTWMMRERFDRDGGFDDSNKPLLKGIAF